MIRSINIYTLDSKVTAYSTTQLEEFGVVDYHIAARDGRTRLFKNEKHYKATDNKFLGEECDAVVATINGVIYKISFRYLETDEEKFNNFYEHSFRYLFEKMGKPSDVQTDDITSIIIWESENGNVILECSICVEIILTSSIIRNAEALEK